MARPLRAGASSSAVIFYPSARVFHLVENTGLISQHFAWGSLPRFFCQRFVLVLCRSVSAFPFAHGAPAQGGRVVLCCDFYPPAHVFHPVENTGLLAGLAAPWRFLQNFYKFFILSFDTSVFISLK
jgi:hypothetical protein